MDITTVMASGAFAGMTTVGLTFIKERYFANKENQRKTRLLAIRLSYELECFVIDVSQKIEGNQIFDEELYRTQRVGKRCVNLPVLPIEIGEIDWCNLDNNIISRIMNLRHEYTLAVEGIKDGVSIDYEIGLRSFMQEASSLGKKAWDLANEIKDKYDIPKVSFVDIFYDPINDNLFPENEKWVTEFEKDVK